MESRIPLPTDNIYKFYALFGLLLIISSMGALVYYFSSVNNLIYEVGVEYEVLKSNSSRSVAEEARFKLLDRRVDVAIADKKFYANFLGAIIGAGVVMMVYGFWKWHTEVQPIQDEMARLGLEKLRKDVGTPKAE